MRAANEALIVIDIQNDFCPGGALAVNEGDQIVSDVNALMSEFQTIVLTQDWHPAGHSSFASSHEGAKDECPAGCQSCRAFILCTLMG